MVRQADAQPQGDVFAPDPWPIDDDALRQEFRARGRVRIANVLAPAAADAVCDHLIGRDDWRQVFNLRDRVYELDRAARDALTAEQSQALSQSITANATAGFQYRFDTLRVADGAAARRADPALLARLVEWLSGERMLARIAGVTGIDDIRFADAQATRFTGGDMLTGHDDLVDGKGRRAAYVLGLTRQWRIEWGGLLMFHGPDGRAEAIAPGFNCLDIFAVPQMHSVSQVTESACFPRLSVTGWLRNQEQPR